ncbi:glycosyltransferase family 2 protein [Patescibacteria group bacterium]|nr:glycosyltransferase family 2 protein [Patescibacteria group bacterium]MBU2472567.1 glycosyltransferase family 2 protein [Patescibacteria group bacterium]
MLSIIITHHKTPVLLKLCLKSIKDNIEDIEHEIFIVDSQPQIEIQKSIKNDFPQVNFISFPKNVGYAKIVNTGIKKTKGEYILILNADILILKESVQRMLEFIKENSDVGIIGPQLLTFSNQVQSSCFKFPTIGAFLARRTFLGKLKWGKKKINNFLMQKQNLSSPKEVNWVQGSAMLVRKKVIEEIGLMDERFFMYLEDTDWCRRFWQNGYKVIYFPFAQMSHYYYRHSRKWGGFSDILLNKYTRIHLISALKYSWKWRNSKI